MLYTPIDAQYNPFTTASESERVLDGDSIELMIRSIDIRADRGSGCKGAKKNMK